MKLSYQKNSHLLAVYIPDVCSCLWCEVEVVALQHARERRRLTCDNNSYSQSIYLPGEIQVPYKNVPAIALAQSHLSHMSVL